jgi:hypothetical protein
VHTVGEETVDGVRATHVHADINTSAADAAAGAAPTSNPAPEAATFPVDIWIANGRIVRLAWTPPLNDESSTVPSGPAQPFATEDFSDFGTPVSIVPPASSETSTASHG